MSLYCSVCILMEVTPVHIETVPRLELLPAQLAAELDAGHVRLHVVAEVLQLGGRLAAHEARQVIDHGVDLRVQSRVSVTVTNYKHGTITENQAFRVCAHFFASGNNLNDLGTFTIQSFESASFTFLILWSWSTGASWICEYLVYV